jgi:hypothetical protein
LTFPVNAIVLVPSSLRHLKCTAPASMRASKISTAPARGQFVTALLAASKAAASAAVPNACESFTAEITPHFRPDQWLVLSTLHKTQAKTAWERIVALELDRPLRITGQMFFDGSHRPCVGEEGRPPRISVWEIHPVYGIDVCKKQLLTSCRVNVADDWKSLDEAVQ